MNERIIREIEISARNLGSKGFPVNYIRTKTIEAIKERIDKPYQKQAFHKCWSNIFVA